MELDESIEAVIYRINSQHPLQVREIFKAEFGIELPEKGKWEITEIWATKKAPEGLV